jgi:hypothetical protein
MAISSLGVIGFSGMLTIRFGKAFGVHSSGFQRRICDFEKPGGLVLSYHQRSGFGKRFRGERENGAQIGEVPRHSVANPLPNAAKKTCILVLYCAFTCNNETTSEKAVEPLFMRIFFVFKG